MEKESNGKRAIKLESGMGAGIAIGMGVALAKQGKDEEVIDDGNDKN